MQITNITKKLKFQADLASNIFSQSLGLSFSKPKNMLFRFQTAGRREFWMFGMAYDIFIAFIGDDGRVFQQFRAGKMTLNPKTWKVYKPDRACKYVLETPKKIVDVGDKLKF